MWQNVKLAGKIRPTNCSRDLFMFPYIQNFYMFSNFLKIGDETFWIEVGSKIERRSSLSSEDYIWYNVTTHADVLTLPAVSNTDFVLVCHWW